MLTGWDDGYYQSKFKNTVSWLLLILAVLSVGLLAWLMMAKY